MTSQPAWMSNDPRLTDIQIAGSNKTSLESRFRRGLGHRSLAEEFKRWENHRYGASRLQKPVKPNKKFGHIKEYVRLNSYRFGDNDNTAYEGIKHGLKLLHCESLLGGIGFSVILVFHYDNLRHVRYPELKDLKEAIQRQDSVVEFVRQKSDWFGRCQSSYNGKCSPSNLSIANPPIEWYESNRKKRKQIPSSSLPKYLKPREPHHAPFGTLMATQQTDTACRSTPAEVEALTNADKSE